MRFLFFFAAFAMFATNAVAELQPRPNGMVYDTDLNITWIADTNLSMTLGVSDYGYMTWDEAHNWVDGLTYGGYSDWRLPSNRSSDPGCIGNDGEPRNDSLGFNCTISEMGHLYNVEFDGTFDATNRHRSNRSDSDDQDIGLFNFDENPVRYRNLVFWTSDIRPTTDPNLSNAGYFSFWSGGQWGHHTYERSQVLIVRDGDVPCAHVQVTTRDRRSGIIRTGPRAPRRGCDTHGGGEERNNTVVPSRRGTEQTRTRAPEADEVEPNLPPTRRDHRR